MRPFDLDVSVDRGVATYAQPLPDQPAGKFLDDRYPGWGQRANEKSSPAYVEMTGTPSATVTVSQGGESLGSVRWGDVLEEGAAETPKARIELTEPGRNWVDVSVVDDETGQSGALPGPLPLARRRPVPALRPPQPHQLRPRHLQLRRGRRPAHGPGHLRLHRWDVPGLAAHGARS